VFVAEAGSWQQYGGEIRITNVNSESSWHQHRLAWIDFDYVVNASAHVQAG
jgi:hypothetical protein